MEKAYVMKEETAERIFGSEKIMNTVAHYSAEFSGKLCDESSFEHACYQKIASSIEKLEASGQTIENLEGLAYNIIKLVRRDFYKNRVSKRLAVTAHYDGFTNEERDRTFQIEDENFVPMIDRILAEESESEVQKEISVLANGDVKKEFILKAWANGLTNDLDLSRLLAQSLGGKAESHRKYIARFRANCQKNW